VVQSIPSDNPINRVVAHTTSSGPEALPGGGGPAASAPTSPQPPSPRGPLPQVRVVKNPQVLIEYKVRNSGASGVKSVELYLTQDNGLTWQLYGGVQNVEGPGPADPKDGSPLTRSLKVLLPSQEGLYGLYVVVRSGAGLAKPPPAPGTLPQIRIELDQTPPEAMLIQPEPDPASPLKRAILRWKVSDRNLASQPVTLQWAEHKEGPWEPIGEPNMPNTEKYSWELPPNLPAQVYLRLTVRDVAGNVSVAETEKPISLDLNIPDPVEVNVKVDGQ
jgi:hypothetical protein